MAEQSTSDNATSSSSTAMPAGNCNSSVSSLSVFFPALLLTFF
jgi:hypothetical protein